MQALIGAGRIEDANRLAMNLSGGLLAGDAKAVREIFFRRVFLPFGKLFLPNTSNAFWSGRRF
ncbi:MAG: hypothetical protein ACLQE9_21220 [Roseiarcus sp.]